MNLKTRIYNDFFAPSKEGDYEKILKTARDNGYEFHTILSFEDVIANGVDENKKYLILRRDIDTADFKILRKMLALEKKYGARATYYFRKNTCDIGLMKDIAAAGGEASYHFEEIASFCYRYHIKSKEHVLEHIEEIKDLFIKNYIKFKNKSGQPCLTVASHGDYMNVRLGIKNCVLIDERVREETGIIREAYDKEHERQLTSNIFDMEMDVFVERAISAIERGEPVLELLTHPRQWNSPFWVNLKEEVSRVLRGLYMKM